MQGYPYVKRFLMEPSRKHQSFVGENRNSRLVFYTDQAYPRIRVTLSGADAYRAPLEMECEEFVAVKGFKAHGKRITTWNVGNIEQLEPLRFAEEDADDVEEAVDEEPIEENLDPDAGKSEQQVRDELTGQLRLFPDE